MLVFNKMRMCVALFVVTAASAATFSMERMEPSVEWALDDDYEEPAQQAVPRPPVKTAMGVSMQMPMQKAMKQPLEQPMKLPMDLPMEMSMEMSMEMPVKSPKAMPVKSPKAVPVNVPMPAHVSASEEVPVKAAMDTPLDWPVKAMSVKAPMREAVIAPTQEFVKPPVKAAVVVGTKIPIDMSKDCPAVCPALHAPICATSDRAHFKLFNNDCELRAANCERSQKNDHWGNVLPYQQTDGFWCSSTYVPNLMDIFDQVDIYNPSCFRPCPQIYSPVCVSNGVHRAVITNECLMDVLNCAVDANARRGFFSTEAEDITHFKVLQPGSC